MALLKRVKGGAVDKLLENSRRLNKANIEVGHFQESGIHEPSGMPYVKLLEMWAAGVVNEYGDGQELLVQDIRRQVKFDQFDNAQFSRNRELKKALDRYASQLFQGKVADEVAEGIAKILAREYKMAFGVQGEHMDATDTPLYDTGELADATSYKTSLNPRIKRI
jgi:hypothetical protein